MAPVSATSCFLEIMRPCIAFASSSTASKWRKIQTPSEQQIRRLMKSRAKPFLQLEFQNADAPCTILRLECMSLARRLFYDSQRVTIFSMYNYIGVYHEVLALYWKMGSLLFDIPEMPC